MHLPASDNYQAIDGYFNMLSDVGVLVGDFYTLLGRRWPAELPRDGYRGPMRQCYANTFEYVQLHPEYVYCEGFAVSKKVPIPVHHAWAVSPDGRAEELTWAEAGADYWGVPLKWDFVLAEANRTRTFGLLGEMIPQSIVQRAPEAYLAASWPAPLDKVAEWLLRRDRALAK